MSDNECEASEASGASDFLTRLYVVEQNTGVHLIVAPIRIIDPDEIVDDYWSVIGPEEVMSYHDADTMGVISDIYDQFSIDAVDATSGSLIGNI